MKISHPVKQKVGKEMEIMQSYTVKSESQGTEEGFF